MLPGRTFTFDSTIKLLRRRGWLLVVPTVLGALGGLVYSRSQQSLYRSDAVIQVVPQRIPDSYVQSTVTARVEDRLSSIAQEVLSRTQLEALIVEFDLYRHERQTQHIEDVVALMNKRVQVAPIEATGHPGREAWVDAFRVSFDYYDPRMAREVVLKLADFFIARNAKERGTQADQTSAFLEAQLADARSRLEAQERKLKIFRERNSGRLPTQTQTNMQGIQNTQMALQAMVESLARDRDRKLVLERLYSDAAAEPEPTITVTGDAAQRLPVDATPEQRLQAARNTLAQLELHLSPKHPDVVRAKRLIADLEAQVAAEALKEPLSPDADREQPAGQESARRRARLREMRVEIESVNRQIAFKEGEERRLRAEIASYQSRLEAVPGIESEWVALTRDYDTLQATYRELLAKSENSRIAAKLEQRQIGEQFRILDPPRLPLKPESPNRLRINVIGLLAGFALGVLLLVIAEYRDSTMRSEVDVRGAMDLPVLVVVPFVRTEADARRERRRQWAVSTAVALASLATGALFWWLQLWKFVV